MKIRSGFVSNSSSSSFILAIKKNITEEEIKDLLLKNKSALDSFRDSLEYIYGEDELLHTLEGDTYYNALVDSLSSKIFELFQGQWANPLELEDWLCVARKYSNEAENLLGTFLYEGFYPNDSDIFKIKVF